MRTFLIQADGTLEDSEGQILFYSMDRFVADICEGDCCFMCGASPKDKEFNEEHVIPKWILRKLDIYKQYITLPNGAKVRYDQYTVACCKECNKFLGKEIEDDICTAVEGGLESVNAYILKNGPMKIFLWLSLIFFKTHLKDTYLRKHLDKRKGEETISSDYDWGTLHHIHCMVRAIQTGISISNDCLGSTYILSAKVAEHYESYDYADVYAANTILLRVGDIAFLAVLDDSCAAMHFFSEHFKRITGSLSPLQLREVMSHLAFLNYKLKHRPLYRTQIAAGDVIITADLPEHMELDEHSKEEFGEILYANVAVFLEKMTCTEPSFSKENISSGYYHFLFKENGEFVSNSMDLVDIKK